MQRHTGKFGLLALASAAGMAHGQDANDDDIIVVPSAEAVSLTVALSVVKPDQKIQLMAPPAGFNFYNDSYVIATNNVTIEPFENHVVVIDGEDREKPFTITGTGVVLKNLTIRNGLGVDDGGAIEVLAGSSVTVEGCTIEENVARDDGGGIRANAASVTVKGSTFRRNTTNGASASGTANGGAIHMSGGTLLVESLLLPSGGIRRTAFASNSSFQDGGAIAAFSADVTITDAVFTSNSTAGDGGAVWVQNGSLAISGARFEGNSTSGAFDEGAAVAVTGTQSVRIDGTEFIANTAGSDGGALWFQSSASGVIADCEFRYNRSGRRGGALALFGTQNTLRGVRHERNVFLGNTASLQGGAVFLNGEVPVANGPESDMTDCVFVGNRADDGAVLFAENGPDPLLLNCTMVMNGAADAMSGAIEATPATGSTASTPQVRNAIMISNGPRSLASRGFVPVVSFSNVDDIAADTSASVRRISVAGAGFERMPSPGAQSFFGDDPATLMLDESLDDDFGDLRLTIDSPSIDAGDATFRATGVPVDLDLLPRVVAIDGYDPLVDIGLPIVAQAVDHGAFEFQPVAVVALPGCNIADLSDTPPGSGTFGQLDGNDIGAFVSAFLNGCPPQ